MIPRHSIRFLLLAGVLGSACGGMRQVRLTDRAEPGRKTVAGPIAVGASITPELAFDLDGSGGLPVQLVAARPDVLSAQGHRLTGTGPGVSAVLVRTEDGAVLDFVHLWVVAPTHIALEMLGADRRRQGELLDTVELAVGESLRVRPLLYAGNQELAGTADTEWTVAAGIAEVLRDGDPTRRRLIARTPGRTTVTVAALGLESTFELVVVPD